MSATELTPRTRHWKCPSCPTYVTDQATEDVELGGGSTRMHQCPGNGGLTVPLIEVESPDHVPDARHVPQMGEVDGQPVITSTGTEHGSGRIDRTVHL